MYRSLVARNELFGHIIFCKHHWTWGFLCKRFAVSCRWLEPKFAMLLYWISTNPFTSRVRSSSLTNQWKTARKSWSRKQRSSRKRTRMISSWNFKRITRYRHDWNMSIDGSAVIQEFRRGDLSHWGCSLSISSMYTWSLFPALAWYVVIDPISHLREAIFSFAYCLILDYVPVGRQNSFTWLPRGIQQLCVLE